MDTMLLETLRITTALLLLSTAVPAAASVGPWCLNCPDIRASWMCTEAVQCLSSEICLTEFYKSNRPGEGIQTPRYRTGCKVRDVCERLHLLTNAPSPLGRRQSEADILCSECCDSDFCNAQGLCQDTAKNPAGGPMCFACHNVQNIKQCKLVIPCAAGEECSARKKLWEGKVAYDFECVPQTNCSQDCMGCCKGDYCQARMDTSHIQCDLAPHAPRIISPLQHNMYANLGDTVVLPCQANGTAPLTYVWSREGVPLTLTSNCVTACLVNGNDLQLSQVDREDTGHYRCDVTNRLGRDDTSVFLLVGGQPTITVYPKFISPSPGDVVTIYCNMTGAGSKHRVDFVFDTGRRPASAVVSNSATLDATLTFTYHGPQDSGVFTCRDIIHHLAPDDSAVVANNLGFLSCSTSFARCPAEDGMVCSGLCSAGCGGNNTDPWRPPQDSVCQAGGPDMDSFGGCAAWLMRKDSTGHFLAKLEIGGNIRRSHC